MEGFDVQQAGDCKTGLSKLDREDFDVVLCDVKLPDGNGVELTKKIKDKFPLIEIIILTAYGNIPDGVQAIKNGAFDYITKGDDNNKILPLLHRAVEKVDLAKRVVQLEKRLNERHSFENIIGKSKILLQTIDLARNVSKTDTTVLLTGETGIGRKFLPKQFTKRVIGINRIWWRLIVPLSVRICWKVRLDTKLGHSQGQSKTKRDCLKRLTTALFSWMKLGKWRLIYKQNYYEFWKLASSYFFVLF